MKKVQGMSSDGPTPPPCNQEIFKKGQPVAILNAAPNATEQWVKAVARTAKARVDWHYAAGRAVVLCLGNWADKIRVAKVIKRPRTNA